MKPTWLHTALGRADPFLLTLLATVILATVLPCRGVAATAFDVAADAAIVLVFFLHGAKLSREAIFQGIRNWRVHALVLAVSFLLFPALGLAAIRILPLPPEAASGVLFLTLLPSTVQSSVALTAMAGGNVAAAVCSASLSNVVGVFATPLLATSLIHRPAGSGSVQAAPLVLQLILPFALGHLARPWVRTTLDRHKSVVGLADRGSILLVVYTAFSAAVIAGIWTRLSPLGLIQIALACAVLLAIVLSFTWLIARRAGFSAGDRIVIQFCGSKKSLVSGLPIAGVLFPGAQMGFIILPLMVFHQMQLIACAVIARRYARAAELTTDHWTAPKP
ncbi:bile acid:sodium symporter family protein [Phenylobacterium sp. VNQ135]|uniref:bile acid:sodium symporter family protein n=1 Tax=Phenylobacterium sp. VNQ135 TaxID=3400922 RepID=UPI003C0BC517